MKDDFKPSGSVHGSSSRAKPPAFEPLPVNDEPGQPFVTPEVAAARDNQATTVKHSELPSTQPAHAPNHAPKGKGPAFVATFKQYWSRLSRNQRIIISSILAGLLISSSALAIWAATRKGPPPAPPAPVVKEEPPAPTIYRSKLTGLKVTKEQSELPVTGVMIENSPDARPQSGIQQAGIVFEAIAEGGITRFLTLFQEARPEYIGPVRSVRPYYLDFLKPFDAPIAHAGGSAQALAMVRSKEFKDLEAFQNPNYYQRVSNRYAPHNLYTGRTKLLQLQKTKGWTKSTVTSLKRKEKEEPAATPTAKTINLAISGFYYNPTFTYAPKTNTYLRSMAGVPHKDEKTGRQISPKVLVVLVMSHRYAGIYSVYGSTGKGQALIFQDGTVTKATWHKAKRTAQYTFSDAKGKDVGLNPGQTWISVVTSTGAVTYK